MPTPTSPERTSARFPAKRSADGLLSGVCVRHPFNPIPKVGFNATNPTTSRRCRPAVILWIALIIMLAGCLPPQAQFDWGLGTNRITGTMASLPVYSPGEGGIVVAFKQHHQFITDGEGRALLRPTAHVVPVSASGTFYVSMPADVVAIDLLFIAPGRLTEAFHFKRQLGVGDITYKAAMVPMSDWRNHYYTYLIPQLEYLIVEPRYRLAPEGVELLSRWLQAQNRRLAPDSKSTPDP